MRTDVLLRAFKACVDGRGGQFKDRNSLQTVHRARIGGEDAFEGGGDIDLIMATLGPWSCLGTDVRPLEVRMASE